MPGGHNQTVTLEDVARHAGVSRSTVSLVLGGSRLVARATRERVSASMKALGYVYNRNAALLRSHRSRTVGLLLCQITEPFYAELTDGLDAALDHAGCGAFLANAAESLDRQTRFIERMREHHVDGLVLCPVEGTSPRTIEQLRAWRLPCVQALRLVSADADFVGTDNRAGTDAATTHLIGLGHRRIAFIGGLRRTSVSRDRIGGYRDAMRRHGLEISNDLVIRCASTRRAGAEAVAMLLDRGEPPTAAVCYNDVVAFGVMFGLHDRGLRPGRDFAVVGFDDIDEAEMWRPGLTTVAIDSRQLGRAAADLLLQRIAAPDEAPTLYLTTPRLIVRESCGARSGGMDGRAIATDGREARAHRRGRTDDAHSPRYEAREESSCHWPGEFGPGS